MTTIHYECKGKDGMVANVSTLPQAQEFVDVHGGTYQICYTTHASSSEAFARDGHRIGGRQGQRGELI